MIVSIALLGEYTPTFPPHLSTNAAIAHVKAATGLELSADWISTADIDHTLFERYAGIWVAPGSPYKDMDKTLAAIRHARENNISCFGTCGGFQHMIIEYARNVLGFKDAQHAERSVCLGSVYIAVGLFAGRTRDALSFKPNSRVAEIYGAMTATEQYYCNFGINPD